MGAEKTACTVRTSSGNMILRFILTGRLVVWNMSIANELNVDTEMCFFYVNHVLHKPKIPSNY
ncbi:hypothetical protein BC829DRAFT_400680, partial [Chytridium lagenaria]